MMMAAMKEERASYDARSLEGLAMLLPDAAVDVVDIVVVSDAVDVAGILVVVIDVVGRFVAVAVRGEIADEIAGTEIADEIAVAVCAVAVLAGESAVTVLAGESAEVEVEVVVVGDLNELIDLIFDGLRFVD